MERNRKTGRLGGPRLNMVKLLALTTALAVVLAAGPAALATDITIDPQPTPTHGKPPIPPDQGGGNQGPVFGDMVTPVGGPAGIDFSKHSVTVAEGGATDTYGVKLKSDPGPGKTVTISIASSDGEVTVSPTSLDFTHDDWNAHQYVTVTAIDDTEVEGDHDDEIRHTASANYGGGLHRDLDVDVADNDAYGPVLAETGGSTAVAEGDTEADTYTIALPYEPRDDVTVTITPDSQVTVNGHNHSITATIDKHHWRDTVTVYVRAVDDSLVEGTPHFGMITNVLSSDDERFDGGRTDLAVSITDNDVPARAPGTPAFAFPDYEVSEGVDGGVVIISVARTGGTEGAMTVSYATGDGTATSPDDYTFTTGTIAWPDGVGGVKTFTVPIIDDSVHEPDETFNLNLYLDSLVYPEEEAGEGTAVAGTASHGVVGADVSVEDIKPPSYGADRHTAEVTEEPVSTATVTIIDDDPPDFGSADFTHESYTVDESEGSVSIGVERLGGHDGILTVRYETAAADTATSGVDYSPTTGTLEWGGGEEGVRDFSIGIIDDSDHEDDESFEVRLYFVSAVEPDGSGPEEAEPIASATVTILDDDAPVFGTAEFTAETYEASEASGSVTIGARRVGGTDGVLIVRYATGDGTATSPDDYAATTGTLEWGDGESEIRTFTVPIANDSLHEHDETFGLTLSFVEDFEPMIDIDGEEPVIDTATITIIDDDPPDFGSARFTKETYEVTEGCGTATFEVERTGGTDGVLTVHWATSDGSAHSPGDYTASSGDITWETGETESRTISVVIGDDSVHRPDRSFGLTLTHVEAHEVEPLSKPGDVLDTATVVIREDDAPVTGSVRFTDDRFVVVEDEGPVAVTVERYGGSDDVLTVEFATSDGSAKCRQDYVETHATLTWDDGETGIMTVYVDIRDDRGEEETQSFHVKLYRGEVPASPAGSAETVGQPAVIDSADVVIIDDDPPVAEEEEEVTALGVKCCKPPAAATSLPEFADLIGHWGRGDCQLAAALGIVAGSADGLFRPDGLVTRAEYVTFLGRTMGCPPTDEPVPFTDVSRGDWFYADLAKEVRNGVVVGFSDGTFRPNEPITRAEAALMLSRAMTHCGWPKLADATVWDILARYADGDLVSPAARAGVALALSSEMWLGRGGLALMPQATLTRAEAAAMMVRLWRWLVTLS